MHNIDASLGTKVQVRRRGRRQGKTMLPRWLHLIVPPMIDNDVELDERQVSARANMDGRGRLSSSVKRDGTATNAPASRGRCAELKTVAGLTTLKVVEAVCKQAVHV